ncbi:MAG: hypothetical protein AAF802_15270 [Planctomycetota bacterium]
MAFKFQNQLDEAAERRSKAYFATLSRRINVASPPSRLSHGGIIYIAKLFGISRSTIDRGILEIEQFLADPAAGRIRRPGGGRKKESIPTASSKAT